MSRNRQLSSVVVAPAKYPAVRMRRNRKAEWSRRLNAEYELSVDDLIWPVFLIDGAAARVPVAHKPSIDRVNIAEAVNEAEWAVALGVPEIAKRLKAVM